MINYIIGGLILIVIVLAVRKITADKKSGNKCAGCAHSGDCRD